MRYPLEALLDACIAQLNNGEDLEAILARYPEVADELRPLLAAAAWARIDVPPPTKRHEGKRQLMQSVAARRRAVESTDGYITELKAGVPLRELLHRAPAHLRPALVAAWRMRITEPPRPSEQRVAEGREALMAAVASRREARAKARSAVSTAIAGQLVRSLLGELASGLMPAPSLTRRFRMVAASLVMTLAVGLGVSGVTTVAADSTPGEAFYAVKRLGESAQLIFTFDPARRAILNIEFGERRLSEMQELRARGEHVPQALVESWLASQSHAISEIRRLPLDQRQLLVEMLLDSAAQAERVTLTDELVSRASGLLSSADVTGAASTEPTGIGQAQAPSNSGPLAMPRPLPREEGERDTVEDEQNGSEAQAPGPVGDTTGQSGQAAGAPAVSAPMIQPAVAEQHEDGNGDDSDHDGSAEQPPSGEPPADDEPSEGEEQPAARPPFVAPPVSAPTPEPSPSPPASGEEPGDSPQQPQQP